MDVPHLCSPSSFRMLPHGTQGRYSCWELVPPYFVPKALKGSPSLEGKGQHSALSLNKTSPCRRPKGYPPSKDEEQSALFNWGKVITRSLTPCQPVSDTFSGGLKCWRQRLGVDLATEVDDSSPRQGGREPSRQCGLLSPESESPHCCLSPRALVWTEPHSHPGPSEVPR